MEDRTVFQPSAAGSVKPGARLNGIYEIETLIAQGGMGEVYRGFNIQTRHQVAIKMIRPEYANDPEIFNLFRREALILNNLTHEAIVRYFVFSVDPDLGRAYLAMEFVDGPSLTKRLVSGALPLEEVKVVQSRRRFRSGDRPRARDHPSRHLARQHHLARRRRAAREDCRLRHRPDRSTPPKFRSSAAASQASTILHPLSSLASPAARSLSNPTSTASASCLPPRCADGRST